jgi:hypothetical protein
LKRARSSEVRSAVESRSEEQTHPALRWAVPRKRWWCWNRRGRPSTVLQHRQERAEPRA